MFDKQKIVLKTHLVKYIYIYVIVSNRSRHWYAKKCNKNISNKNYAKLRNYLSEIKRIGSDCSPKGALHFNKRAPLFDKEALGQSRRTGRGWNLKMKLISS